MLFECIEYLMLLSFFLSHKMHMLCGHVYVFAGSVVWESFQIKKNNFVFYLLEIDKKKLNFIMSTVKRNSPYGIYTCSDNTYRI